MYLISLKGEMSTVRANASVLSLPQVTW